MSKVPYIPYEKQYLDLVRKVLTDGAECNAERTGTGSRMITGLNMRVDLAKEFPILSTKSVAWGKAALEDEWFISGSTSVDDLQRRNVRIWDEWASETGQLGPMYGAMWRRRPATNIVYVEKDPVPHDPATHTFVNDGVRTNALNARSRILAEPIIESHMRRRVDQIVEIWAAMIEEAHFLNMSVLTSWLNFENFYKHFSSLPGNEYLHLAIAQSDLIPVKKVRATNHQSNANHYGPDTVVILPSYLIDSYPEINIPDKQDVKLVPVYFIDQLQVAVDQLKARSQSRRIVIDSWDPSLLPNEEMRSTLQAEYGLQALAPCHCLFQFNVVPGGRGQRDKLDISMYQRSVDMFLGLPFNMVNYALIAHAVAKVANLDVGSFNWSGGNCHIYNNHQSQMKKQLRRKLHDLVQLDTFPDYTSIDQFNASDFKLVNYNPAAAIKGKVAV